MTPMVRALPKNLVLKEGNHKNAQQGMCVMEAVAFVAGEKFSDHPVCASEVIGSFLRTWNDAIPDDEMRTRLLSPLVLKLVDSKSTPAVEEYRAFLAFDWLTRIYTPAWLDLVPECAAHATALRALAPIVDLASARAAAPVAESAAGAAAAAWSAAESAAESAAWSAAWSAAESAAWSAAKSAARSAARSAAWSAAKSAARSAARSAVLPTRDQVQLLALDLVERMLAVTPETLPAGWVPPSQAERAERSVSA